MSAINDGWEAYYRQTGAADAWSAEASTLVQVFIDAVLQAGGRPQVIADLGCGDGRNIWPWIGVAERVIGVDTSPTALAKLVGAAGRLGVMPPETLEASMTDLPLEDGVLHAAQCIDSLPQVLDTAAALREFSRTLAPGGRLLFNVFTPRDCAFGEGKLIGHNIFEYKDTVFRFFEVEDVTAIIPPGLRVESVVHQTWQDPPHIPFRPVPHTHDGIYFICRREEG